MLSREQKERSQSEIICIDDLVLETHLLRKIDETVDFKKIYDIVGKLYSADKGRPSTDPVVLFKAAMIQHIYGIPSLRRTAEEISLNIAYRWFLGYSLTEKTPHFSTFSYNFSHRFTEDMVQQIFDWILNEINDAGYLSPEAVFIDRTHIKANANMNKTIRRAVPEASKIYSEQLLDEINKDRETTARNRLTVETHPKRK